MRAFPSAFGRTGRRAGIVSGVAAASRGAPQ